MRLVRALSRMHVGPYQMLVENELWPADDPFVLAHPDWFSADLEPILHRSIPKPEPKRRTTATQEPVEAR